MFLMTIQNLGSEEQVDKWGRLAAEYKIHGCYAQTELGHGSNVNVIKHNNNRYINIGYRNYSDLGQEHR